MKTRAHAELDDFSCQDSEQTGEGDPSDGEVSVSSSTDDGSSEDVFAMSQRTKHVHKKKRSKLKRNDSGSKTFPTSCCTVASGRGSLKRVQHLRTLKTISKARLPLALFIGLPDFHVVKLLQRSDWKSTTRPFPVESSMRVLCFDVVPLMLCDSGRQKRVEFSDVFFTKASDVEFFTRDVMSDTCCE